MKAAQPLKTFSSQYLIAQATYSRAFSAFHDARMAAKRVYGESIDFAVAKYKFMQAETAFKKAINSEAL